MAKMGCAKCGGTKKMAKGGTTKSVSISKPGAGVVKETKGDTNQKMGIYGIAQTGPTGPNDSGIATMKKGGSVNKMQVGGMVKKPLVKAQAGRTVKKVGPNKYAKEQIIVNKKDGSGAAYVATNKGTVYSMSDKKNSPSSLLSIDTTGYSKGKPNYDQIFSGSNGGYKKTTVKRKDVKPLLNSMKKETLSFKKSGGVVKSKKK